MDIQLEHDPKPIDRHWRELSDLTIYEAAFWMVIDSDPLAHADRWSQDGAYEAHFSDHPGGSMAVEKGCEIIFSAIRDGHIHVTDGMSLSSDELTSKNHIRKTDWIAWCRSIGYFDLADSFEGASQNANQTTTAAVAKTGISKLDVMNAFDGLHFTSHRWNKSLASPPAWLLACRIQKGDKSTSATWDPVLIALELYEKQIPLKKLDAVFVGLKEWTEEWQNKSALLRI